MMHIESTVAYYLRSRVHQLRCEECRGAAADVQWAMVLGMIVSATVLAMLALAALSGRS